MGKIYAIIPKHSLLFSLMCLSGVLIIVFAGIVPKQFSLARLDQKIKSIQFQIEEQKSLYPIYQVLHKKSQTRDAKVLPAPAMTPLLRTQLDAIPSIFRQIAQHANIDTVSVSPNLNSLGNEPRFLLVDTVVRCDFLNFRKFLIGIGEVPYLERIEEIQIEQNEDTMEFKMKIWLALG
jgi:hypothetical protein